MNALEEECIRSLKQQGFSSSSISCEVYLNLRYDGTDCALMCTAANDETVSSTLSYGDFQQAFLNRWVLFLLWSLFSVMHVLYCTVRIFLSCKRIGLFLSKLKHPPNPSLAYHVQL